MRRADSVGAEYRAPRLLEPAAVSVADMCPLPVGIGDPLLWHSAQPVLAHHPATLPGELCPGCGAVSPCVPRWLAERAIAVAQDLAVAPAIGNGHLARSAYDLGAAAPVHGTGLDPTVNGMAPRANGASGRGSLHPSARDGTRTRRRRPSPRPRTISA